MYDSSFIVRAKNNADGDWVVDEFRAMVDNQSLYEKFKAIEQKESKK